MNEIKCPHCHKEFPIDATGYADIVKQVYDVEFQKELGKRLTEAERVKAAEIKLAEAEKVRQFEKESAEKEREVQALKERLERIEAEQKQALENAKLKTEASYKEKALSDAEKIRALEAKIEAGKTEQKLMLLEAVSQVEKERDYLKNSLSNAENEKRLAEQSLKEKYEMQIKDREETIERLKELKQRLSTKMIGETLEQHCEIEFNKNRALGFRNAYFEKDNDAKTGSKGDYIFREADEDGNEIVSIMFEMKNENSETATKKKNEDFLKELDKDRREKNCEYAVLVSLLEADNEYYNTGIVDVSHRYEKMYVIRPQFFIQLIGLLRDAGRKSLEYKAELALVRSQNIDVTNFEEKLLDFQDKFKKNYDSASLHFEKAIEEIDKSIARLEQTKKELRTTDNQLRLANNKAQDVTIKKLTRGNPTMSEKFKSIEG